MNNFFYTLLLLSMAFNSSVFALGLNDISVLVPLPSNQEQNKLLAPFDGFEHGLLIPAKAFSALPQLIPESNNKAVYQNQLKAVAIRIDPCFVEGEGPWKCRPQIRIVWQPIISAGQTTTTRDAAVHSFYEFPEDLFKNIWAEWRQISRGGADDALQVHPQILAEGLSGNYWLSLRSLILKYCGEKNLVRITAMNVMPGERFWIFKGFDIAPGSLTPIRISRIPQATSQGVIINTEGFHHYSGRIMPPPPQDPDLENFVNDSINFKKIATEKEIFELFSKLYHFENPEKHNPGTLDCVSCHLSQSTIQWGQTHLEHIDWNLLFKQTMFHSRWNLKTPNEGPLRTNQLRAFGYFHNQPVISRRVLNETAVTLDALLSY